MVSITACLDCQHLSALPPPGARPMPASTRSPSRDPCIQTVNRKASLLGSGPHCAPANEIRPIQNLGKTDPLFLQMRNLQETLRFPQASLLTESQEANAGGRKQASLCSPLRSWEEAARAAMGWTWVRKLGHPETYFSLWLCRGGLDALPKPLPWPLGQCAVGPLQASRLGVCVSTVVSLVSHNASA